MTTLAIIGAGGRMGCAMVRCLPRMPQLTLAAAVERDGDPRLGQDMGRIAGVDETGVVLTAELAAIKAADVCIDFSFHEAIPSHLAAARQHGKTFVLGTTGLTPEETAAVHDAATEIPVFWASNMSAGVNILAALVEQTAARLGPDYDIEIIEAHHRHKQDAPSGTALTLGQKAAAGRGVALDDVADHGREGQTGERVSGRIGFHAVRGGDIVGDHMVIFAGDGERLELCHRATSRDVLAMGALRAAAWMHGRAPGFYDMQQMLGL